MLWYIPLEGYKERYTMQWSAPKTGWLERNWIRAGVDYVRIDPAFGKADIEREPNTIKVGSVVDGVGRSKFCFNQIAMLLSLAERGKIKDSDVIFLDDFWTPGFEALPYAFHLLGIRPRIYAFLHAQTVDEFDFTHPMRSWMRPIETGMAGAMGGIFVCCPTLKDLVVFGGLAPREKVHVTGHPFSSEEVMERMPSSYRKFLLSLPTDEPQYVRQDKVIWSSRWDTEKNPEFFLQVAKRVIESRSTVKFVICTSAEKIRSNDSRNLEALREAMTSYPKNIILREGLTKEQYYQELTESKVQFNSADQDFVAITLLEASVAGCYPIYPYFRSFPETFQFKPGFMYERLNVDQAADMILDITSHQDLWTWEQIQSRAWIHSRFDTAWLRQLLKMSVVAPRFANLKHNITDMEWNRSAAPLFARD